MNTLEALEREVSALVDTMPVEVVLSLMDKWDRDFAKLKRRDTVHLQDYLQHYVALKIGWHHVKRYLEWETTTEGRDQFYKAESRYTTIIKEARRNYYVAKRRVEGEHASECSCRGCRCIEDITGQSSIQCERRSGRA